MRRVPCLLAAAAAGILPAQQLEAPFRLETDGKPLEVEAGGAAPFLCDWDGDGIRDLLVGQAGDGRLRIYHNGGTTKKPKFNGFEWFEAGGEIAHVAAGDRVGFGPQLADLDDDGHDDVISGSHQPGGIIVFRGLGTGRFEKGMILTDGEGKPLLGGPPLPGMREPATDDLAASPWLVDFDGDGDLDLLVGDCLGGVILFENAGGARAHAFVRRAAVQAAGRDLRVEGDAGPTTADWDGDGKWDLLVGAGDGSVTCFRNLGKGRTPRFAAGTVLVPASDGGHQLREGEVPKRSGRRARVHVADWNGDRRPDLLVGDCTGVLSAGPMLDAAQLRQRDLLLHELESVQQQLLVFEEKSDAAQLTETERETMQSLQDARAKLQKQLQPLQATSRSLGCVWVYLRRIRPGRAG